MGAKKLQDIAKDLPNDDGSKKVEFLKRLSDLLLPDTRMAPDALKAVAQAFMFGPINLMNNEGEKECVHQTPPATLPHCLKGFAPGEGCVVIDEQTRTPTLAVLASPRMEPQVPC